MNYKSNSPSHCQLLKRWWLAYYAMKVAMDLRVRFHYHFLSYVIKAFDSQLKMSKYHLKLQPRYFWLLIYTLVTSRCWMSCLLLMMIICNIICRSLYATSIYHSQPQMQAPKITWNATLWLIWWFTKRKMQQPLVEYMICLIILRYRIPYQISHSSLRYAMPRLLPHNDYFYWLMARFDGWCWAIILASWRARCREVSYIW